MVNLIQFMNADENSENRGSSFPYIVILSKSDQRSQSLNAKGRFFSGLILFIHQISIRPTSSPSALHQIRHVNLDFSLYMKSLFPTVFQFQSWMFQFLVNSISVSLLKYTERSKEEAETLQVGMELVI